MHLHGFFAATSASVEDEDLVLHQPAFGRVLVSELPTAAAFQIVIVFTVTPEEDLGGLAVGLGRPDGSQAANLVGFGGISPQFRFIHAPITVDVFEEGRHVLLLYPGGEGVAAVAEYPFDVVLMP